MTSLIVASLTAALLSSPVHPLKMDNDVLCASVAAWREMRSLPDPLPEAVAHVIVNRMYASGARWKRNACGVVFHPNAFAWHRFPQRSNTVGDEWPKIVMRTYDVLSGSRRDFTKGATSFCSAEEERRLDWCRKNPALYRAHGYKFVRPPDMGYDLRDLIAKTPIPMRKPFSDIQVAEQTRGNGDRP